MPEEIELYIDGKRYKDFVSYKVDADLYTAADAFSVDLGDPSLGIEPGGKCYLSINGALEMTGIIDFVNPSGKKDGGKFVIQGRDLMGLLVDAHVEEFITLKDYTLKALCERLIANVPFINKKQVYYNETAGAGRGKLKNKGAAVGMWDTGMTFSQTEPGMTVFEVLKEYSRSIGLLFYCRADGSLVFGKPKSGGAPSYFIFKIRRTANSTTPWNMK